MIPKKIHYCWFGDIEKLKTDKRSQECIATWKKYLPDYEFKLWNEKNFPVDYCDFTKQAYEKRTIRFRQ